MGANATESGAQARRVRGCGRGGLSGRKRGCNTVTCDLAAVYGHRGHGEPRCRPGRDVPDPGSLPHVACMAAVSWILRRVV